jgi:hypothetical protein
MAYTATADIIVPSVFAAYVQQLTTTKSELIKSGLMVEDPLMSQLLGEGGKTFDLPSWKDLVDTDANVSSGTAGSPITPLNITTSREIFVRLSRNQAFGATDLLASLAGADPMMAIANRFADYWVRQQQLALVATTKGLFADNAAAPAGSDTHTQNDMTVDISGAAYVEGSTDFSAEAFIDAAGTMGDASDTVDMVFMHSLVYHKALKNNLIDTESDAANAAATRFGLFLGRTVFVDDGLPKTGNVCETWLFGRGSFRFGSGAPRVAAEIYRLPLDAAGGGSEALVNRVEWGIHPVGHAFVAGTIADGGPSNAATSNNLAHADSWSRRYPSRKQIKICRLITREA